MKRTKKMLTSALLATVMTVTAAAPAMAIGHHAPGHPGGQGNSWDNDSTGGNSWDDEGTGGNSWDGGSTGGNSWDNGSTG